MNMEVYHGVLDLKPEIKIKWERPVSVSDSVFVDENWDWLC